jgi:hypothetical protein
VLTFGSGGGFTGAITTYTLYPDGNCTAPRRSATNRLIARLDRKLTAGFFKKAADLLSRTKPSTTPATSTSREAGCSGSRK